VAIPSRQRSQSATWQFPSCHIQCRGRRESLDDSRGKEACFPQSRFRPLGSGNPFLKALHVDRVHRAPRAPSNPQFQAASAWPYVKADLSSMSFNPKNPSLPEIRFWCCGTSNRRVDRFRCFLAPYIISFFQRAWKSWSGDNDGRMRTPRPA
jgi:hypothetical protein